MKLNLWMQTAFEPGWGNDVRSAISDVAGSSGPLAPFVRPGRSKVAAQWFSGRGRMMSVTSLSQQSRLERLMGEPQSEPDVDAGVMGFTVWETGHPHRDGRPEHVNLDLQYAGSTPQMYIELSAPAEDSSAMLQSMEAFVRRWGARFAGAFYSADVSEEPPHFPLPPSHPYVLRDGVMRGLLQMGLVDPVVMGPSWAMVFRPSTFTTDLIPASAVVPPVVTSIAGPDGDYTMVVLAPESTSVGRPEMNPWLETLRPLMDPALNDPAAAHQLLHAAMNRRRVQLGLKPVEMY